MPGRPDRPADGRPSAPELVLKLATRLRSRGPGAIAELALKRTREVVGSAGYLVVFCKEVSEAPAAAEPGPLHARIATAADAQRYARDIGTDSPRTFVSRLSAATVCCVVSLESRLVHASWATTSATWTREIQRYFVPPLGDAYIYESFTRADARGRGAYPVALTEITRWADRRGVSRLWVAVEGDNASSRRAVSKAGFEPGFEVAFRWRLGRLTLGEPAGPEAETGRRVLRRRAELD